MQQSRPSSQAPRRALVTGATGYIGGRLVPELLNAGFIVRVLVRQASKLRDQAWAADVEVTVGDAADEPTLKEAMVDVDVAYYLLHSLAMGKGFENVERAMAEGFGAAAKSADVSRIVYLGGLAPAATELSPHLESRLQVGQVLRESGVPTAELRAAVIIGSGSASFEMLRYLTERLPAMVTPRWVRNRIQPIAIRDVLRYLVGSADLPTNVNRSFDIGGPDVLTYQEMMQRYAEVAGLTKRVIVPVPVLTPTLSSHWVGLITPVPAEIAKPLVESLRYEVVTHEHDIDAFVPLPRDGLIGIDRAVELALRRIKDAEVTTRWSNASVRGAPSDPLPTDPDWAGGSLYIDEREREVDATPQELWQVIEGIGGERGLVLLPDGMAVPWSARPLGRWSGAASGPPRPQSTDGR